MQIIDNNQSDINKLMITGTEYMSQFCKYTVNIQMVVEQEIHVKIS